MTFLTSADFDLAFSFARPVAADYRDPSGTVQTADPGDPRFDHDALGNSLGLLTEPSSVLGAPIGSADRASIDPYILPLDLALATPPTGTPCTVLHRFDPLDGNGEQRRAWYSRSPARTIDGLMIQAGHHRELGVLRGFAESLFDGTDLVVRYRGYSWKLPGVLVTEDGGSEALDGGDDRPTTIAGAEAV